ncbi:glycoside hydrolase family 16 protein, partial [Arthrospira platensis SPKY1]|nr:glycoside hydrolase family 16 protein [Arthrospira platensis SPKY1]
KFSFQYGILEVRARIDTTLGSWPAIWTLGNERPWPDKGEIDLMEFYLKDGLPSILANAAWVAPQGRQPVWDGYHTPVSRFIERQPDWPERYHVWRMEWEPEEIRLYLDDELLNTIEVERATYADGFNPFRQPHYLLLNLAIGSNGGNPEASEFPIRYEVDYVRVYQKKP